MVERVEIGDATLYCGDCIEVLPGLPRSLSVVSDPPYGINYVQGRERNNRYKSKFAGVGIIGDDQPFDPGLCFEFAGQLLWGANHFARHLTGGRWLVWDKRCNDKVSNDQSDIEMAWVSGPRKADRIIRHLWNGFNRDGEERGVERVHPTQKPVRVMRWSIEFLPDGDVVDPYMGSGTTGVACMNLGRKFVGIEIEPRYFDIACKRIEDAQKQARLFDEPAQPIEQTALAF